MKMTEETKKILDIQLQLLDDLYKQKAEIHNNLDRIAVTICRENGLEIGSLVQHGLSECKVRSIGYTEDYPREVFFVAEPTRKETRWHSVSIYLEDYLEEMNNEKI
tara:strand:- start:596 stop:913 length:318 start_codon:yes stop_codon:yes gene_type:complete